MRGIAQRVGFCALALALACGDDDGTGATDAGTDAEVDAGVSIAAPAPPNPPVLTNEGECVGGWTRVDEGDVPPFCDPYVEGVEECLDHEAHVPGEEGCHAVGRACGTLEAPADAARVFYVREGGDGDGSEAAPFGTIGAALEIAGAGDAILIEEGTYAEENLQLRVAVTIRGACAERVRIVAPTFNERGGIFSVLTDGVVIEDLQLRGPRNGIVVEGGSADVRGVAFVDVAGASLASFGGTLRAEDIVSRMINDRVASEFNAGVAVYDSANLEVRRAVFRGHLDLEAQINSGSAALFEDVVFGARFRGFIPFGGRGIDASGGAQVTGRRVVFEGNDGIGALSIEEGTHIDFEDVFMFDVLGEIGASFAITQQATATLRRATLFASIPSGISVFGGGSLVAEDVLILFAGGDGDGTDGYGIQVGEDGSDAQVSRAVVIEAATGGIAAIDQSSIRLTDVAIEATGISDYEDDDSATGIVILGGASASATRVALMNNDIFSLAVEDGTLSGSDLSITGTLTHPTTGGGGALWATENATVELDRVLIDTNQSSGLTVFGETTRVILQNLEILNTIPAGCLDRGCTSFLGGIGVGVYEGAQVRLSDFRIADNELLGAQVAFGADENMMPFTVGGELDLERGVISGHPIGVNVQVADYDFDRLTADVVFAGNQRNFDASLMQVPQPPDLDPAE
ncbi:MAG: hypothetical protein AAGE52_14460 [Myxococcota bacterium]